MRRGGILGWPQVLGLVLAGGLSVGVFFRFDLLTGFGMVFGDRYDGLIEVSILEHWYNVTRGISHWAQTLYFYPVPATLGYNDGYLVYGLIYSVFRGVGADPFLASELVDVVVKLVGFAGFVAFAVRVLGVPVRWAALGAAVFTLSNSSYVQGGHAQLFSVAFAPGLGVVLFEVVGAVERRRAWAAAGWGIAAGVAIPAWLLTSYYMAWFFMVFCLVWVPLSAWAWRARIRGVLAGVAACWPGLAVAGVALGLGLLEFMRLYLPKAAETGMHGVREMSAYLVSPLDVVNLGGDSLLYGALGGWLQPWLATNVEHSTGFTPVLLLVFLGGGVWAGWRGGQWSGAVCLAVAAGVLWLLALDVTGVSAWDLVYDWVPGAKAVRVVSRVQIFLAWPVVSVAVVGLAALERSLVRLGWGWAVLTGGLSLFLVLEQVNLARVPGLDRRAEMAWLRSVPAVPAGCRAFYVSAPRAGDDGGRPDIASMVGHDVDGMLLAEWFGRPTVNGFASLLPPGWNLLWIGQGDYLARVRGYAVREGILEGLCGVNLETGAWRVGMAGPLGT